MSRTWEVKGSSASDRSDWDLGQDGLEHLSTDTDRYLLVDTRQVVDVERHEEHDGQQGGGLLAGGGLHQGARPQTLLGLQVPKCFFKILIFTPQVLREVTTLKCVRLMKVKLSPSFRWKDV